MLLTSQGWYQELIIAEFLRGGSVGFHTRQYVGLTLASSAAPGVRAAPPRLWLPRQPLVKTAVWQRMARPGLASFKERGERKRFLKELKEERELKGSTETTVVPVKYQAV